MNIIFKKVTVKNFFSYGNPYRKIKIPNIVNDINKKNCIVSLELKIGNIEYKIERGISPGYLKIYKGDILEDSRSSNRLMQKELENIIPNAVALKNVCILSSNQSKPFLDLPLGESREIIENIFGLNVYSQMLTNLKNEIFDTKDKLKSLKKDINFYSNIIKDYKTNLAKAKKLHSDFETNKVKKLKIIDTEISEIEEEIKKNNLIIENKKELLKNIKKIEDKISSLKLEDMVDLSSRQSTSKKRMEDSNKQFNLLTSEDVCPFCSNKLTKKHKDREIKRIEKEQEKIQNVLTNIVLDRHKVEEKIKIAENEKERLDNELDLIESTEAMNNDIKLKLGFLKEDRTRIEKDSITEHLSTIIDTKKINEYISKYREFLKEFKEEQSLSHVQATLKDLLSDDGIRQIMISKDLIFLNSKVNEYLRKLGFQINLIFNEKFNIVIDNPRKKNYQYNNFSEGQKKRIDLAILMAFLDLSKRKNSINTNLLIFDEVLDTSLDDEGTADFMNMLNGCINEGKIENVFIITHKQNLSSNMRAKRISIGMVGEFSVIEKN